MTTLTAIWIMVLALTLLNDIIKSELKRNLELNYSTGKTIKESRWKLNSSSNNIISILNYKKSVKP